MKMIFWLVLVMGYGYVTWAAGKFSKAALSFLDGGYLAFLCFSVLPYAMGAEYFYGAALAVAAGVVAGFRMEEKQNLPVLVFAAIVGCYLFCEKPLSHIEFLFLAFLGGMGLYHASAGIIPDKIEIGKALLSGAGFLCGTVLFSCF